MPLVVRLKQDRINGAPITTIRSTHRTTKRMSSKICPTVHNDVCKIHQFR